MENQISDPDVKKCLDLIKEGKKLWDKFTEKQREDFDFHMDFINEEDTREIDVEKEK